MKIFITTLFCLCATFAASGQWTIGPKIGFGAITQGAEEIRVIPFSNVQSPDLTFAGGGTVKSLGFMLQNNLGPAFVQVEALGTTYNLEYTSQIVDQRIASEPTLHSENHVVLELPITAGFFINNLKVGAGPIMEFQVAKDSELAQIDRYEDTSRKFSTGAQGLVGYKFGKFDVDLRYVYRFSGIVDDFTLGNDILKLNKSANRLTLSVGMAFGNSKSNKQEEEEQLPLTY